MNFFLPVARVAVVVWICAASSLAHSQGLLPAPGVARRANLPPAPNVNAEVLKPLSTNFRITFSGKSGEKAIGELSCLTNSPTVFISGPLDDSATPTSFEVRGSLSERDGGLISLEYQISFQVPVTSSTVTSQAKSEGPSTSTRTVQYQNHSCSGSLLMKPGKAYEILKAGGCSHAVTITPEPEK